MSRLRTIALAAALVLPAALAPLAPANGQQSDASRKERLAWEKELLGIYLSEHPLNALAPRNHTTRMRQPIISALFTSGM